MTGMPYLCYRSFEIGLKEASSLAHLSRLYIQSIQGFKGLFQKFSIHRKNILPTILKREFGGYDGHLQFFLMNF